MSMENMNQEIESIVEQAIKIAQSKQHEYVVTEHLFLALIRHAPFRKCLENYGTEVALMDAEVDAYLNGLISMTKQDANLQPRKTQGIERGPTFKPCLPAGAQ